MKNDFIIDHDIYFVGKDIDNQYITTKEVQSIILKGLIEIDRICRKNNIPYALSYGTCLGLYNYGGFIPWDDDADVIINYEDIDRFIKACDKDLDDNNFILCCYEKDKKYNIQVPTFKLKIKNTYLKENTPFISNRIKNTDLFFIDICTFMGCPDNEKEYLEALKPAKRRMIRYCILDSIFKIHPYHMKKVLKKYERDFYLKYKDSKFVSQTPILPYQQFTNLKHGYIYPKEVIYPFKEYDFMGHKFYSFNNIEEFLKINYGKDCLKKKDENGNYFESFPKERRKPSHLKRFSTRRSK